MFHVEPTGSTRRRSLYCSTCRRLLDTTGRYCKGCRAAYMREWRAAQKPAVKR